MKRKKWLIFALAVLLLAGCGGPSDISDDQQQNTPETAAETTETVTETETETETEPEPTLPENPYEAPPMAVNVYDAAAAVGDGGAFFDFSHTGEGYVGISVTADNSVKVQVIFGEYTNTYDIASDGTPSFYPLTQGNGTYTVRAMLNVEGNKYTQICAADTEVTLDDEFQTYLRPNAYVNYDENSTVVKKAQELAAACGTEVEVVGAVYDYVVNYLSYDTEKAASVEEGYVPDLEEISSLQKGICFDYSAMVAAMLRSEGIPCKMIFGYVVPDGIYHAWNMFYTEETGWVTVEYSVKAGSWDRLDATFKSTGADDAFVTDDSNYQDVYIY